MGTDVERRAPRRKVPHVAKGRRAYTGLDRVPLTTLTRVSKTHLRHRSVTKTKTARDQPAVLLFLMVAGGRIELPTLGL